MSLFERMSKKEMAVSSLEKVVAINSFQLAKVEGNRTQKFCKVDNSNHSFEADI